MSIAQNEGVLESILEYCVVHTPEGMTEDAWKSKVTAVYRLAHEQASESNHGRPLFEAYRQTFNYITNRGSE